MFNYSVLIDNYFIMVIFVFISLKCESYNDYLRYICVTPVARLSPKQYFFDHTCNMTFPSKIAKDHDMVIRL